MNGVNGNTANITTGRFGRRSVSGSVATIGSIVGIDQEFCQ
jgi:hypothetical protein